MKNGYGTRKVNKRWFISTGGAMTKTEAQSECARLNAVKEEAKPAVATTFDDFFAAPTDRSLCIDCGKPHDRAEFLYSDDDGNQVWVCTDCAKVRATARQAKQQAQRDARRRMDEFERYAA